MRCGKPDGTCVSHEDSEKDMEEDTEGMCMNYGNTEGTCVSHGDTEGTCVSRGNPEGTCVSCGNPESDIERDVCELWGHGEN